VNNMKYQSYNRGFSLVETLIYSSILILVTGMASGILILSNNSFKQALASRSLGRDAQGAMVRSVLETRQASGINVTDSILGSNTSTLALYTTNEAGSPIEASLSVVGDTLYLSKEGDESKALTSSSTKVVTFKVDRFTTVNSEGVNIELVLSPFNNPSSIVSFYDTAIVRGGY